MNPRRRMELKIKARAANKTTPTPVVAATTLPLEEGVVEKVWAEVAAEAVTPVPTPTKKLGKKLGKKRSTRKTTTTKKN